MVGSDFDKVQASRFARMALDCVHKEYANKTAHALKADADVKPPRRVPPAFYRFLQCVDPEHLEPTRVGDVAAGKLWHLAGLNLSRAWMMEGIVSKLPLLDRARSPWRCSATGSGKEGSKASRANPTKVAIGRAAS